MKKLVIGVSIFCLMLILGVPKPVIALQNEKNISTEEQEAIDRFYADLEDAYEAIIYGEGGYNFLNLETSEIVTYDVITLFENEFENHQYEEIRCYCNENQIAIVEGTFTNNIMPFACVGDGCPDEPSVIIKQKTGIFQKTFDNPYYLEKFNEKIEHTATVSFSAKYEATAHSPYSFVKWDQTSDYLYGSTNSSSIHDSIVLQNTKIDLYDETQTGTATFSVYSKTAATDSYGVSYYKYFICNGSITIYAS